MSVTGPRWWPLYTDAPCHSRCGTLQNPHCSVAMSLFVWGFRPTRYFFIHMETSPMLVKGCKFWPMLGTSGHWAVRVLKRATPTVAFSTMIISEDPWHSHLPSVWQWSYHYLFLRLTSVAVIFYNHNIFPNGKKCRILLSIMLFYVYCNSFLQKKNFKYTTFT